MTGTTTNTRRKLIKSQVARAAAAGLVSVLALSLAACSTESTSSPDSPSASATQTETKPEYAQLTLKQDDPVYIPDPELVPKITAFGWTSEEVTSGQRLVVDYIVNEFLDSSALETGDEGYRAWHANEAKNYLSDELRSLAADGSGTLVLGNIAGRLMMPELIKDGDTRAKNPMLIVTEARNATTDAGNVIVYKVDYSTNYRVSDSSAAKFMSDLSIKLLPTEKHLTPEQFLASDLAMPALKDGAGENYVNVGGAITTTVIKDAEGNLAINAFQNESDVRLFNLTSSESYFTGK